MGLFVQNIYKFIGLCIKKAIVQDNEIWEAKLIDCSWIQWTI